MLAAQFAFLAKPGSKTAGFQRMQAEKSAFARSVLDDAILLCLREKLMLEEQAPRTEADWRLLLKTHLGEVLPEVENALRKFADVFDQYRLVRAQLAKGFPLSHAFVHADISTQLDDFFGEAALRDWPFAVWQSMPRYLGAIDRRMANLAREDRAVVADLTACRAQYVSRAQGKPFWQQPEPLRQYRVMLEELRVSFFAQTLGTQFPVSFKRLNKQWLEC